MKISTTVLFALIAAASLGAHAQERNQSAPGPTSVEVEARNEIISCPGCDLRKADFAKRDLTDADLARADLTEADFRGATLNGTILNGATLTGAHFEGATLNRADLSRSNLAGAKMDEASLTEVDLQYANLEGTNFGRAKLHGVLTAPDVSLTGEPLANVSADDEIRCGRADLSVLTSRIYVSPAGTDSAECGAKVATACKTIRQGVARCGPEGCGVLVMHGEYPQTATLEIRSQIDVYGGCVPKPRWKPQYFSTILAPPGGVPAVSADGFMFEKTIFQGFQIVGSDATAAGAASIALFLRASGSLYILNTTIVAGAGGPGTKGTDSVDVLRGGDGNGREAGTNVCGQTDGGEGGAEMSVRVTCSFLCAKYTCPSNCGGLSCRGFHGRIGDTGFTARGGNPRGGNCKECVRDRGGNGEDGESGRAARCGAGGTASWEIDGRFTGTSWFGGAGSSGFHGGSGGGGGGGGAGGYRAGPCLGTKTQDSGNSGGGGGAGGCGAIGAGGGRQGGGSFAAIVMTATLRLDHCRLIGGAGGAGGDGGNGAKGGGGGHGAVGARLRRGGYGGKGGTGGAGGSSGGGAGGNGGPSVLIALLQEGKLAETGMSYYLGASGRPGLSGYGGATADGGTCRGSDGAAGVNGLVAKTRQY